MKKLAVILSILLLFPLLSAVQVEMKENFTQGETFLMKLSGNFYEPISKNDISFFRDHVQTSIIPEVVEIDGTFYIYAQLYGKDRNDYSIVIEDVKSLKVNELIEEDIMKNFSINSDSSDFSVEPGVVFSEGDFSIEIQNLRDSKIDVSYKILNEDESAESSAGFFDALFGESEDDVILNNTFSIKAGEKKKINFKSEDFTSKTLQEIQISTENTTYFLPVYVNSNETSEIESERVFSFEPNTINVTIATNSSAEGIIYLKNLGDSILENVSLHVSEQLEDYVSLSEYEFDEIKANSSERIYVYLYSNEFPKKIEGQISASVDDEFAYVSVFFTSLQDYIPTDDEGNPINLTISFSRTCNQVGGEICQENQECSGDTNTAIDGLCCLAKCEEVKKSSTGKIIGWTMIFFILILLVWFYLKKYKSQSRSVDLLNPRKR